MYAVVEYNDYRKEQRFEVISVTDDIEYAKKLAFQNAKKALPDDEWNYKITSKLCFYICQFFSLPFNHCFYILSVP